MTTKTQTKPKRTPAKPKTKTQKPGTPIPVPATKIPEPIIPEPILEEKEDASAEHAEVLSIVIPYVTSTAKWDELRIALRSIVKYFNPNWAIRLFVVADKLPEWMSDEVTLIPCEQITNQRFAKAYDAVKKLKAVIAHPEVSENFIYTYDDTVFLNPAPLHDYAVARINRDTDITKWDGSNIWKEIMMNTVERLVANKLPTYNYETHLPRIFSKTGLSEIFEKFGFQKRPYHLSTIYFNYFGIPRKLLSENKMIKADIRSNHTLDEINELTQARAFLNYNDDGLNENLKKFLLELFPDKCRFEV